MKISEFIKKYSDSFPTDKKWNDLSKWEHSMQHDLTQMLDKAREDEAVNLAKHELRKAGYKDEVIDQMALRTYQLFKQHSLTTPKQGEK